MPTPAVGVALAAALATGLWWIPIRAIEATGLTGPYAGVGLMVGGLPAALVWAWAARAGRWPAPRALGGAAACGTALMCYSAAVADTTVVRAVLLFYLAPAWSLGIEWWFLGRRLRWLNAVSLGLAGAGAACLFRGDVDLSGFRVGDGLALAAGLCWSVGAALLATSRPGPVGWLTAATCAVGGLVGAVLAGGLAEVPAIDGSAALVCVGFGAAYLVPSIGATLWSASQLRPTTMSFLLTAEIVSGVVSAALWLDEPFGAPELAGSLLVGLAAAVEVGVGAADDP